MEVPLTTDRHGTAAEAKQATQSITLEARKLVRRSEHARHVQQNREHPLPGWRSRRGQGALIVLPLGVLLMTGMPQGLAKSGAGCDRLASYTQRMGPKASHATGTIARTGARYHSNDTYQGAVISIGHRAATSGSVERGPAPRGLAEASAGTDRDGNRVGTQRVGRATGWEKQTGRRGQTHGCDRGADCGTTQEKGRGDHNGPFWQPARGLHRFAAHGTVSTQPWPLAKAKMRAERRTHKAISKPNMRLLAGRVKGEGVERSRASGGESQLGSAGTVEVRNEGDGRGGETRRAEAATRHLGSDANRCICN